MAVNLSIRNVPDDWAEKLINLSIRERAKRNHRSQQAELLAILEEAVRPGRISLYEASKKIRAMNFSTPNESTQMIREDRDAGHRD